MSGKLNDEFVYELVSHLEYALLCHMAGMEQSIVLNVESFCRVQDNKEENKAVGVPLEKNTFYILSTIGVYIPFLDECNQLCSVQ